MHETQVDRPNIYIGVALAVAALVLLVTLFTLIALTLHWVWAIILFGLAGFMALVMGPYDD
jgi:hypothetical protein